MNFSSFYRVLLLSTEFTHNSYIVLCRNTGTEGDDTINNLLRFAVEPLTLEHNASCFIHTCVNDIHIYRTNIGKNCVDAVLESKIELSRTQVSELVQFGLQSCELSNV